MPTDVIAAFDLDGTLTEGGSVFPWLMTLSGRARVYGAGCTLAIPLAVGAIRSGHYADQAKERLFHRLLAGRDEREVRETSREFALSHLATKGRSGVLARLEWHKVQGHKVVLVSASPQMYVDVLVEALHLDGGLGTRLGVDPRGQLTGSYLGRNCRGSEKLRRLREWIELQGVDGEPEVYAYGNSRGDRRMLRAAAHPFNVGRLGRFGSLRHFPTLRDI